MKNKLCILALILTCGLPAVAQISNQLSLINLGTGPNTGTGDPLRTALAKANTNFVLLATALDSNTIASGTTLELLSCEAVALIAAGGATAL